MNEIPKDSPLNGFRRKELQEIRKKAEESANMEGLCQDWKRIYTNLADAVNTIDAFIARTEVKGGLND